MLGCVAAARLRELSNGSSISQYLLHQSASLLGYKYIACLVWPPFRIVSFRADRTTEIRLLLDVVL